MNSKYVKHMDDFKLEPPTKLDENSGVLGLDVYLNSLERHYFSDVSLRSYTSIDDHRHALQYGTS